MNKKKTNDKLEIKNQQSLDAVHTHTHTHTQVYLVDEKL